MYCSKYSQTLSEIVENLEMSGEYMDQKPFAEQIVMEMEEAGKFRRREMTMPHFQVVTSTGMIWKISMLENTSERV